MSDRQIGLAPITRIAVPSYSSEILNSSGVGDEAQQMLARTVGKFPDGRLHRPSDRDAGSCDTGRGGLKALVSNAKPLLDCSTVLPISLMIAQCAFAPRSRVAKP
jgi:hypothetical protein